LALVGCAAMDAAQEKPDVEMQNGLHLGGRFFAPAKGATQS